MLTPKVSIVMPVYNAEKFLIETLDSVKNQTFTDFECVIVNDGSTDNSLEIINSYVENDKRFKVFTVPNSGCANIPRDISIKNSTGEFVFNLDADDKIDFDCLEKMVKKQLNTNSDIVLLRVIGCNEELNGEMWRLPLDNFDVKRELSGKEACSLTIGGWQISCSGMLFKKKLYNNIPIGKYMNSDELTSRYILYNAQIVTFSDANYYYRNNNNSISKKFGPRLFERLAVDNQLEQFVYNNFGVNSSEGKAMRYVRFFNLVYLQSDFIKHKKEFSHNKKIEIANNLKNAYYTQKLNLLKKELSVKFKILFLEAYFLFKINSFLYVLWKDRNGRKYYMK